MHPQARRVLPLPHWCCEAKEEVFSYSKWLWVREHPTSLLADESLQSHSHHVLYSTVIWSHLHCVLYSTVIWSQLHCALYSIVIWSHLHHVLYSIVIWSHLHCVLYSIVVSKCKIIIYTYILTLILHHPWLPWGNLVDLCSLVHTIPSTLSDGYVLPYCNPGCVCLCSCMPHTYFLCVEHRKCKCMTMSDH